MNNSIRTHRAVRMAAGRLALAGLAAVALVGWSANARAAECLNQAFGGDTVCTANDISVASITVNSITDACNGSPNDTFTFTGTLNVVPTATNRYDIGFYIGASPQTSTNADCFVGIIDPAVSNVDGDACGDTTGVDLSVPETGITAPCIDSDNDGFFDVNTCSSWKNSSDGVCTGGSDAIPETKSKCNCQVVNTTLAVPNCNNAPGDPSFVSCDDNNPCTDDICNPKGSGLGDEFNCSHTNNSNPCPDNIFCNGAEVCTNGSCQSPGDPCVGGDVCNNVCNEAAGNCLVQAGTVCRASAGVCDTAETCTGSDAACPTDAFQTGTVCRAAGGVCDIAETCSGSSASCPADVLDSQTVCRASAGVCDVAESCNGDSVDCPADAFQASSLECRASGGVCDVAENCTGSSATCPTDTFVSSATECRASAGVCDIAENCTGASATCPGDAFQNGTTCRAAGGVCDAGETCNGSSASCPADVFSPSTAVCRGSAGICDVAENCTGDSAACPADEFAGEGTQCRASAGICDVAENCTGESASCPGDTFQASTTECRASAGICDVAENCSGASATCPTDTFLTSATECRASNGVCDVAENCSGASATCPTDTFQTSATQCRASAGICDVAETCSGSSASCPADAFQGSATQCRAAGGVCDTGETCTGSSATCPTDSFASSSTVCRASAGVCDTAESCTGSSATCPTDAFQTSATQCRASAGVCDTAESCTGSSATCPANTFRNGTTCRASAGVCDTAETCNGSSATCPTDTFVSSTTVCRASAGECDVAETCTGNAASCPANGFKQNGTSCTSDDNVCTNDTCNGSGQCTHTNNTASCDDGLFCTTGDKCSGGQCHGTARDCADDVDCTVDSCSESQDACVHTPNNQVCGDEDSCTTDTCNVETGCQHVFSCRDICRRPGWYGKRSGTGNDQQNLVQSILDSVGGVEVCGQSITETSVDNGDSVDELGLSSALEGLCVRVHGDPLRALYRELVAASLNCAISGSEDCDTVVNKFVDVSFSNCSHLCEIGDGSSQQAQACIDELDCYNSGGRLINGKCATGSCDKTHELCGGEYGPCPPFVGIGYTLLQTCGRFPGNCRDEEFCNPGIDIPTGCSSQTRVRTPSTSPDACKDARNNSCTIDNCD